VRSATGTTALKRPCRTSACRLTGRETACASYSGRQTEGQQPRRLQVNSHPIAYCIIPRSPSLVREDGSNLPKAKRHVAVEHELVSGKIG